MSYTKEFTATQGAWLKVADGVANAFVQLQSSGPVKIAVAQSLPGLESWTGAELDDAGLQDLSIDGMEAGDAVYVRSRHDEDNLVVVVAPGVAPA